MVRDFSVEDVHFPFIHNLLALRLHASVCLFFLKGSDAPIQLTSHTNNMASSKQMEEPQKKLSGNLGEHMVGLRMK